MTEPTQRAVMTSAVTSAWAMGYYECVRMLRSLTSDLFPLDSKAEYVIEQAASVLEKCGPPPAPDSKA